MGEDNTNKHDKKLILRHVNAVKYVTSFSYIDTDTLLIGLTTWPLKQNSYTGHESKKGLSLPKNSNCHLEK